jgi:hypothetical protein
VVRMFRAENSRALAISKHERRLIFRWLTHCALGLTEDDVYYVMRVFRQSADGMLNLFRVEVADPKRVYQSPASDSASASAGVKTCPMCERSSLCWYRDCVESRTRNIEVDPLRDDGCGIFRLVSSFRISSDGLIILVAADFPLLSVRRHRRGVGGAQGGVEGFDGLWRLCESRSSSPGAHAGHVPGPHLHADAAGQRGQASPAFWGRPPVGRRRCQRWVRWWG